MSITTDQFTPAAGPALIDRIIAGEEQPIDAREVARLPAVCRGGRPIGVGVVYRWARRGVRGVVLETAMVGGGLATTREAVGRFLRQLNDRDRGGGPATSSATPRRQQAVARRAHTNAMTELARAGLVMDGGRR